MAENVSNIKGKGMDFDQRVVIETVPPDKLQGTVPALIGGAHWGPVGEPTLVRKSFSEYFGTPVVQEDENDNRALDWSGLAADYHLKYSQLCYFTRVTDGTDKAASRLLSKEAEVAKLVGTGAIQNTTTTIYPEGAKNTSGTNIQNNVFILNFDGKTKVVVVDPSSSAKIAVDVDNVNIASLAGRKIMFSVDDILVTYTILGTEADMDAIVTALKNALKSAFLVQGITVTDAEAAEHIYRMSGVDDINLDDDTFEAEDIIKVEGDDFYQFNGTTWVDLDASTAATLPTNPDDDTWYFDTDDEEIHQFDKAGNGGAGAFDAMTMHSAEATGDGSGIDLAVAGDYYYAVGTLVAPLDTLAPGIVKCTVGTGVDDGTWEQVPSTANVEEVTSLPTLVVDDSWHYETTGGTLGQYDYTGNSYTLYSFEVVNNVVFASMTWGISSTVVIHNFPGTEVDQDNAVSAVGSATPINGIISDISDAIEDDDSPSGSAGLYVKTTGSWGAVSGSVTTYGDAPASPSDDDFWKSDGSGKDENGTVRNYGWYQYNDSGTETSKWESIELLYFAMQDDVPADTVGEDGDYVEVGGDAAMSDISIGFDEFGRLVIATADENAGADQEFNVGGVLGNMYLELKIDDNDIGVDKVGSDAEEGGKIEAIYTGELGNEIYMIKTENINGYSLSIVKGDTSLGEFFNYSLNVDDDNFIGDLINNDRVCLNFVKVTPETGVASIPNFELNTKLYLTGGTSGLNNLEDFRYISAIGNYNSLDLYDIDIIGCPGVIGEEVVKAMQEVCEKRKDCFCCTESPQAMSPFYVERWHNGLSDTRTEKLDSMYVAVYYPWVLINTSSVKLPKQWAPPTVRVVGAIGYSDLINQNKFAPTAGHKNTPITDVEALEVYLEEDDKKTLYADVLDNNINPIVYNKRNGYFIDGQKTTKRGRHPFNRIRTVRTALHIKRRCAEIAPDFFWEPIDGRTRARLEDEIATMMTALAEAKVIKADFEVVCDTTNNTDIVEADHGLIASITWSPIKSVEKIKIISTIIDQQVTATIEAA